VQNVEALDGETARDSRVSVLVTETS